MDMGNRMDRNKKFAIAIGFIAGIVNFANFSLKKGIIVGGIFGVVATIIVGGVVAFVMRAMDENKKSST